MTLLGAVWQKQGEDHPVLFTREIVTHEKQKVDSKISGLWQEGEREEERERRGLLLQF